MAQVSANASGLFLKAYGDAKSVTLYGGTGGGSVNLFAGNASTEASGDTVQIIAGSVENGLQNLSGGDVIIKAGNSEGSGTGKPNIDLYPGTREYFDENINNSVVESGYIRLFSSILGGNVSLDTSAITPGDKIVKFQNEAGTLPLLETSQIFSGLNRFEADVNSTIYIGSFEKTGCIAMGDSDGDGITYITANDGVLSSSATKPTFCQ